MEKGMFGAIRSHHRAGEHIERLLGVCRREKLSTPQTAYLLATVHHESRMGLWLLDQESGWAYEGRHHLGNTERGDGPRYRGRGYIPIIGRIQYAHWEQTLGLPLLREPDLAAEPYVAAEIAVRGMRNGSFTGHYLAEYLNESDRDYLGARRVVNGQDRAVLVARYAQQYEAALRAVDSNGPPQADIKGVQRQLRAIGWPLVVDGILGTFTRRALSDFQAGYTFDILIDHGHPDAATTRALKACVAGGGYISPHFRYIDFRTGGSQKLSLNNRTISVRRELVHALERYRERAGRQVEIASGYRSVGYNHRIGASPTTQHLVGRAVDLWRPRLPVAEVAAIGAFTTIGTRRGLAVHLEVSPDGSTERPQVVALDG